MHIARLARADDKLLASFFKYELRFVFREYVRGAIVYAAPKAGNHLLLGSVPSSGSRPTLSGRSYTGPSKPEARRCRSGSTRSRPGRRLTKRGVRHTVDVRQRPASARRSTGLSICLFRRAQTQRRRARAGDQARLTLGGHSAVSREITAADMFGAS